MREEKRIMAAVHLCRPGLGWPAVVLLGFLGALGGCQSCQLDLSRLIEIEYDQRVNFTDYHLQSSIDYIGGKTHNLSANGVWLVYNICQIKNEKSGAVATSLQHAKFYVEFDGKRHYAVPFKPADLTWPNLTSYQAGPAYDTFKGEVITLPNPVNVPAQSAQYALPWRIAVLVTGSAADFVGSLRYDSDQAFLLTDRGWTPEVIANTQADEDDLYSACRGPM